MPRGELYPALIVNSFTSGNNPRSRRSTFQFRFSLSHTPRVAASHETCAVLNVGILLRATNHTQLPKMYSMSFSSILSTPLNSFAQSKLQLNCDSASAVFLATSFASSKSAIFRDGFSILAPTLSRFSIKSRAFASVNARAATDKTIHDFTVKDIDGKDVSLSKFKGKVLLIVNVASRCGLTSSNYTELSNLYETYKTQGFEILAFPCNQFGGQEPGSNSEIKQFACTRFKAEFPIFDKVDVNGPNTAPVYQFLKSNAGGFLGDIIKWNFEKFLVDKNGKVVERYPPTTSPLQIEKDIQKLLTVA